MVTAKVRFLTNNLVAELTCKADELKKSLEEIGVLTPLSVIKLDNARTLQICEVLMLSFGNIQISMTMRLLKHLKILSENSK